jgi:hypothetical protein
MNKQTNFEDNIYILFPRIRLIRDLLVLDIDPELFLDKTMDDLEFIDHTLNTLQASLSENQRLIERDELFGHLSELEWQFEQLLSDMLSGNGSISAAEFPAIRDKLTVLRMNSLERRKTADDTGSTGESKTEEPLVSSDELNELLRAF